MRSLWIALCLATLAAKCLSADNNCTLSQDVIADIAKYENVTKTIVDYFVSGPMKGRTWQIIADFLDKFGNRLTGSKVLEDSIDYMVNASRENGLENIHTEELDVPYWLRGNESVVMIAPVQKKLPMLGLGTSVGTPPEGITAEVVVVESFAELQALPDARVRGKIVVFNAPFTVYGDTVAYRRTGASEAAKRGAVAMLLRSIAPFSIATPHTGSQVYAANVTRIPAAAITEEDADYMHRQQTRGVAVRVTVNMSPTTATKKSRNFASEITGGEWPDRIVMVSAHIDSWDVGVGAMDDAGGCAVSWLAPLALKRLGLRPKRTVRTILFTAEEQGIIGANAYADRHAADLEKLNFVMESDSGTFAPRGLFYEGSKEGECMVREILRQFSAINATEMRLTSPGPDIRVFVDRGVPGGGLHNANERYFWFHHTDGDTMSVLDKDVMDRNAGFWAAVAYVVADMKADMPKHAPIKP